MIEITKNEAESLMEFIEANIFDNIRVDEEIDSIEWLCNVTSVYQKCQAGVEGKPSRLDYQEYISSQEVQGR